MKQQSRVSNAESIVSRLKEVSENIGSGLFGIDEETQDELMECGAREYYVEDLETAVDEAIKWMELDIKLRKEVSSDN